MAVGVKSLEVVHRLAKIGSDGSAIASNQEADHRGRQTAWYKISESKLANKSGSHNINVGNAIFES